MIALLTRSKHKKPADQPPPASPTGLPSAQDDEAEDARYKPIDLALVRRMLGELRPYRRHYAFGTLLGLVHIVLELLSPRFTQEIIDHCSAWLAASAGRAAAPGRGPIHDAAEWAVRLLGFGDPLGGPRGAVAMIVAIVGLWAVVIAGSVVLQRWTIIVMVAGGERVQFGLRKRLFEKLQQLSMSFYDRTKLGRIISRCTSDISAMRDVNVWGLFKVLANGLMVAVAAAMLAATDWRLFLAVSPLGVVVFLVNRAYLKRAAGMFQVTREGWTRVSTNMAENITGMRVVTAFDRQAPNLGAFNALQAANTDNNVRAARVTGVFQPLLDLIGFAGKVVILVYGGYLVVTGRFPPGRGVGAVVAAYLYWDWFMNPIRDFGNFYNQLMMAMAGAERVFNLLDMKPDVQDEPDAKPLPRIAGRVEFDHVTFGYHPDRPVLHDVSFVAEPGQMVALVGATGSGKSSIVSLIARFYQPQRGRVLVDGHDVRHVTGDSLHTQMGLVLQTNYLFTGTVLDNILYARPGATEQDATGAARAIGSYDAIAALQDGFRTEVGERGANMSLGQRQLICFTRAFLADPRIFMLDEATSAVDTATELLVQRSLERLLAGRTTFVVAHRLSTIMRADQILVIDAGRIIERGTHRQLVAAGGKYAHLYEQFVTQSD